LPDQRLLTDFFFFQITGPSFFSPFPTFMLCLFKKAPPPPPRRESCNDSRHVHPFFSAPFFIYWPSIFAILLFQKDPPRFDKNIGRNRRPRSSFLFFFFFLSSSPSVDGFFFFSHFRGRFSTRLSLASLQAGPFFFAHKKENCRVLVIGSQPVCTLFLQGTAFGQENSVLFSILFDSVGRTKPCSIFTSLRPELLRGSTGRNNLFPVPF